MKVEMLRHAGGAHGAVENDGAVSVPCVAVRWPSVDTEMQAAAVHAHIEAVDDVLDDLTEGQRDDGQIVALKSQHRDADEHTGDGGKECADHHGEDQADGTGGDGVLESRWPR